jgi:hypothetical protein
MKPLFLSLFLALSVNASPITWGVPTRISGDSDVSTDGALIGAFNFGLATTVNGVPFSVLTPSTPNFGIAFTESFTLGGRVPDTWPWNGSNSSGGGGWNKAGPFYSLSAGYQTLLDTYLTGHGAYATLTMGGLAPGASYQFQWWSNLAQGGPIGTYARAGGSASGLMSTGLGEIAYHMYDVGQFAIGSFIADATGMQTIDFGGSWIWFLNGFQLRETSSGQFATAALLSASPVPESGATWLLLAAPLAGLLFVGRKLT